MSDETRERVLKKPFRQRSIGLGRSGVLAIIILILVVAGVAWRLASNPAPSIQFNHLPQGIGRDTPIAFEVRDSRYRIQRVRVAVEQNGRAFPVPAAITSMITTVPAHWWQFGGRRESQWGVTARVGGKRIPQLKPGRATLRIEAVNDSWGRFFRGGRVALSLSLPVRFTPPQVSVLTTQHYINQGGAELAIFRVSPGTVKSGVQAGNYFFPSCPARDPLVRLGLFAFPYDLNPSAPIRIVARDDAGNQTLASFDYKLFPKKFHTSSLNITDDFMERVVPPIMSQMPDLADQGSLLKNFLLVNGRLRQVEARQLIEISKKTSPHFLWTQPFIQAANTKVEAYFADYRTYTYDGKVIDHQTHLGFDLAGLAHMPVDASNDGVVVFAGFFGIYGNAVVIDHGCGLQTLYGHLSQIAVKPGEAVKRGQEIGHSGQTGLAGGDHLHFTVLLAGVPIDPTEWWDPHWIHDRIATKLADYR